MWFLVCVKTLSMLTCAVYLHDPVKMFIFTGVAHMLHYCSPIWMVAFLLSLFYPAHLIWFPLRVFGGDDFCSVNKSLWHYRLLCNSGSNKCISGKSMHCCLSICCSYLKHDPIPGNFWIDPTLCIIIKYISWQRKKAQPFSNKWLWMRAQALCHIPHKNS